MMVGSSSVSVQRHVISTSAILTAFAITKEFILVGLDNGEVYVFSPDGQLKTSIELKDDVSSAFASNDGNLIVGSTSGLIRSIDMNEGGSNQKTLIAHTATVSSVSFHGTQTLITSSRDWKLKIWNVQDWTCKYILAGHTDVVVDIALHGRRVVSASYDGTCRIWDVESGVCLHTLVGHRGQVRAVAFDGSNVVSGGIDKEIRVWSAQDGMCSATLRSHTSLVSHIGIDNGLAITAGADGKITALSLKTLEERWVIPNAHPHAVNSIQIKNGQVVSGGSDDVVKVWRLNDGSIVQEVGSHSRAVWRVGFTEDGQNNVVHVFWSDAAKIDVISLSSPEGSREEYHQQPGDHSLPG